MAESTIINNKYCKMQRARRKKNEAPYRLSNGLKNSGYQNKIIVLSIYSGKVMAARKKRS